MSNPIGLYIATFSNINFLSKPFAFLWPRHLSKMGPFKTLCGPSWTKKNAIVSPTQPSVAQHGFYGPVVNLRWLLQKTLSGPSWLYGSQSPSKMVAFPAPSGSSWASSASSTFPCRKYLNLFQPYRILYGLYKEPVQGIQTLGCKNSNFHRTHRLPP